MIKFPSASRVTQLIISIVLLMLSLIPDKIFNNEMNEAFSDIKLSINSFPQFNLWSSKMTITLLSRIIASRPIIHRLLPAQRTLTNNVTKFLQPLNKNDVTKLHQPWTNLQRSFHTTPPRKLVNPLRLVSLQASEALKPNGHTLFTYTCIYDTTLQFRRTILTT